MPPRRVPALGRTSEQPRAQRRRLPAPSRMFAGDTGASTSAAAADISADILYFIYLLGYVNKIR